MKAWLDLMEHVLMHGEMRPDRTGTGTLSCFGLQAEFDNSSAFPAVTAKRLAFEQVKAELACFLRGHDNLQAFHDMGCTIWDGNGTADYWTGRFPKWHRHSEREKGWLGRIYGVQWRRWMSYIPPAFRADFEMPEAACFKVVDQIARLQEGLRDDPFSRRHVVTALNPGEEQLMCLPPCHVLFQCYVRQGLGAERFLDLRVDMRSVDLFLGLPFDVASYALLQRLLARDAGLRSGRLVFQLGDAHIYLNHQQQVREVLAREPLPPPTLALMADAPATQFMPHHAQLVGYASHPAVKAPLNV